MVGNQGDGRAPHSKLFLFLVPKKGPPKPIGSRELPRLPSGRAKKLRDRAPAARGLKAARYRLRALVKPSKTSSNTAAGTTRASPAGAILAGG